MAEIQDRRTFSTGGSIFRQGMTGSEAFIIQSGVVEIVREVNGREEVVEICEKGALIGVNAIVEDDQPRLTSARALTPVLAVAISRQQVSRRIARADPLIRTLIRILAEQARGGEQRKSKRHKLSERAICRLNNGPMMDATVVDISVGGARLVPELPGSVGDEVEIELRRLDPMKARIVGLGRGHTRICFEIDSHQKQTLSAYINDLMGDLPLSVAS
ncbi:MAG: cyclic nucleotide-binding domain-containing protein [Rhodospirillales bacterium]